MTWHVVLTIAKIGGKSVANRWQLPLREGARSGAKANEGFAKSLIYIEAILEWNDV
jgi:hypothetical protein